MLAGRRFFKLSGSGNDFVAFDATREDDAAPVLTAATIRALCARGEGIGADGVMLLRRADDADFGLTYHNADGSLGELCGNASLCAVRLAVALGYADPASVRFTTDAGRMRGRLTGDVPEIDLCPAEACEPDRRDLREPRAGGGPDEQRIGFARVGVPHVVILCDDSAAVDLAARAPALRHHPALADGANVSYVSRAGQRWAVRTYERGVEAETLACGTGSVATALLLAAWGETGAALAHGGGECVTELTTRSGRVHRVRLTTDELGVIHPSLSGSARIVYRGEIGEGKW